MDTSRTNDQKRETATSCGSFGKTCVGRKINTVIADKMHKVPATDGERAARQDAQPAVAVYGKKAAEVLDESADYLQQLDYEKLDAKVREYVRQKPVLSLLIAGVTGLITGAIFRRR